MGFQTLCIAVLVLQALGAVRARPSEVSPAEGTAAPSEAPANLLNKTTIYRLCPEPPASLATAQELSGDWCELEHLELTEHGMGPPRSCERLTLLPDGNLLRAIITAVVDGRIDSIRNGTFSRISNESWLNTRSNRTVNLFLGFSADGGYLRLCGTHSPRGETPTEVDRKTLARCLRPDEQVPTGTPQQPRALRCDLPQQN